MSKELSTVQLQTELDELILWFASDHIDLDLAVKKYQRGTELVAELQKRLKTAENVITKIAKK